MKDISRRHFIQTTGAALITMMPPLHSAHARVEEATSVGDDLCFTPATVLATAIRQKKVSPLEVIDAVYARLHKINPQINAFCTVTEKQARLAARKAEEAVMRGEGIGPLHGVPVSIKDLFLTRGVRTMFGSLMRETYVPEEDAPVVAKLLSAGAIPLGKTTTPEFGFRCWTPRNERCPSLFPKPSLSGNPKTLGVSVDSQAVGQASAKTFLEKIENSAIPSLVPRPKRITSVLPSYVRLMAEGTR